MCKTKGPSTVLAFGVAGAHKTKYCVQHNMPRCGVEGCGGREIGPDHSGKETVGDASPSSSKHEIVQSPPAQASPLWGGSRGARKQVEYLHIVPTALEQAVALESAAEAVTMPEMEGSKSPFKRDSSVKTEVQVSL